MRMHILAFLTLTSTHLWAQGASHFSAILTGKDAVIPNDSPFTARANLSLTEHSLGIEINQIGPYEMNGYLQTFKGDNVLSLSWDSVSIDAPLAPYPGGVQYFGSYLISDSLIGDLQAGLLYLALTSAAYPKGEIRGQIVAIPAVPVITFGPHPVNPHVIRGDPVTFAAAAHAFPAPSFQWQFSADSNTWSDIAGALGTNHTIASVQLTNAGYYRLVASNANGVATSAPAKLDYFATGSQPITYLLITSSGFQFKQTEVQGYTYVIYASTNLDAPFSEWVAVATNVAGTNFIVDADAANYPQRFYRSKLVHWAQAMLHFSAIIWGGEAIPPNDSFYSARASLVLDENLLNVEVIDLLGAVLDGDAFLQTATGESLFTLSWTSSFLITPPLPGIAVYRGSLVLSAVQRADLLAGRLFLAIASTEHPNGEIRGRIQPVP